MGRSLGGLITVFLAETFPGAYQGALALCGPLGGGRLETDYIGNVRVLFDYFFPGVIPGDVLHVPEMEYSADSPVVKAIVAAILANPQKAVALASVDQIKLPYTTLGQLVLSIVRPIGYNIRGTNDLLARTGGERSETRERGRAPRPGDFVAGLCDHFGGRGSERGAHVRRGDPVRDDRAVVALGRAQASPLSLAPSHPPRTPAARGAFDNHR